MNKFYAAIMVSSLLLSACDNGSGEGELHLAITDAPVDGADAVWITFTSVTVKPQNGEAISYSISPQKINLLNLSGNNSAVLLNETLAAGGYSWIRLGLDDSDTSSYLIDISGLQHRLRIPSGYQTGLKLNREFTIEDDGVTAFTIDFDLRKSIHMTGSGSYVMRPTLRIVDTSQAGSISGSLDPILVSPGCYPGVYVFNEGDPVDDMDGVDDPVVALTVTLSNTGSYDYTAGFLPEGNYTIALTCEANLDNAPDGVNNNNDSISFIQQANVVVTAGADTGYNFIP